MRQAIAKQQYDLLILGGRVICPYTGKDEITNVAIKDGKIAKIGNDLKFGQANHHIFADGKIVVPGIIDIHTHFAHGPDFSDWGVEPRVHMFGRGTTSIADAGSTGAKHFHDFQQQIIQPSPLADRMKVFVNIAGPGLCDAPDGELKDLAAIDAEGCLTAARYNPRVVGLKVRIGTPQAGEANRLPALQRTVDTAKHIEDQIGRAMRVMVHITEGPDFGEVVDILRKGDIVTHCFHSVGADNCKIVDGESLRPTVTTAIEKGIQLDIGHGGAGFYYDVAEIAHKEGVAPATISTDLHSGCANGPAWSMPIVMSKLMAAGWTLEQVIEMATINPAKALGIEADFGHLRVGSPADISVLRQTEISIEIPDHVPDSGKTVVVGTPNIRTITNPLHAEETIIGGRCLGTI